MGHVIPCSFFSKFSHFPILTHYNIAKKYTLWPFPISTLSILTLFYSVTFQFWLFPTLTLSHSDTFQFAEIFKLTLFQLWQSQLPIVSKVGPRPDHPVWGQLLLLGEFPKEALPIVLLEGSLRVNQAVPNGLKILSLNPPRADVTPKTERNVLQDGIWGMRGWVRKFKYLTSCSFYPWSLGGRLLW